MTREIVSYSELDTYRQCPLKHALAYKQRWTKPQPEGSALSRGTSWHTVMELHYTIIKAWQEEHGRRQHEGEEEQALLAECVAAVLDSLYDHETGVQTDQQALVQWMYEGYVRLWGTDRDWLILSIEDTHVVPLPSLDGKGKSSRYSLKVKIDLTVRNRMGKVLVVDHKSAKNLAQKKDLDIDDQFGLYTWACQQLGLNVMASVHNGARTQRNVGDVNGTKIMPLDERFSRTPMFRTAAELHNLAMDAVRTAAASRRTDPPYSSPNPAQCIWKCDFLEAHLQMRKGIRPAVVLKDFGFTQDFRRH